MYQLNIVVTEDQMHLGLKVPNIKDSETVNKFFENVGYKVNFIEGELILSRSNIHNLEQETVLKRLNTVIKLANEMYQFLK